MTRKSASPSQVQSLSPPEAHALLRRDPRAVHIDVRSSMEFLFIGHPVEAINVPWMDEPDWMINPDFVREVRKVMLGGAACEPGDDCPPVVLICRSGKRS
ncbi:MAG TPA: rhodanese-like domain-containing protein, partial [Gammaproteobacteria bacterium]|nr:rhodanese-like domain-containing protein [Gammaproteobacteria bacterium]